MHFFLCQSFFLHLSLYVSSYLSFLMWSLFILLLSLTKNIIFSIFNFITFHLLSLEQSERTHMPHGLSDHYPHQYQSLSSPLQSLLNPLLLQPTAHPPHHHLLHHRVLYHPHHQHLQTTLGPGLGLIGCHHHNTHDQSNLTLSHLYLLTYRQSTIKQQLSWACSLPLG